MKELSFERMEEVKGGNWWQCAAGVGGLAFIAGAAIFGSAATVAVMMTGEGAYLAAQITVQSLIAIYQGC